VSEVAPPAIQPPLFPRNAWPNFADSVINFRIHAIFPGITRPEIRQIERGSLRPVPTRSPGAAVDPPRATDEVKRKMGESKKP
jgi:hypothetical protein